MGGDYSRASFDPLRDYSAVGMQQGHPTTDADWNELAAIFERRIRAGAVDTFGRAVVPKETPTGFEVRLEAGPKLTIGRGRMYVDGLLAENHGRIDSGTQAPMFDRARLDSDGRQAGVLDEPVSSEANDFIDFAGQPYLPEPLELPASPGPHIVYLDVWKREVTAVKDPRLLEPALGGIDTATRWQTVWQVRLLEDVGAATGCGTRSAQWDELIAPSPARLTTDTVDVEDPDDPCLIPPGGGYRGLENHYYRLAIHTEGAPGAARFKWSRDNASVAARVAAIDTPQDPKRLLVRTVGRDSILRFEIGDWVEVTDDRREFSGKSGDMRRIVDIHGDELELDSALSADLVPAMPDSPDKRNCRVIRWDQKGKVRRADGTVLVDLDAPGSDGLIPVPANGATVLLEAGITAAFTVATAGGKLRRHDHWCFWARTEGAKIDELKAAPPLGIHHHYARLAVVAFPDSVSDCRTFWPPAEECGCTVCVSAEGHNSGRFTIANAIDDLPEAGGTVCLGPGQFLLGDEPVVIEGRDSVRLRGHGFGSAIAYSGAGGAIQVRDCTDVRISDLAVTAASPGGASTCAAVHIANGRSVSVDRTHLTVVSRESERDFGVALEGVVFDVSIAENIVEASIATGTLGGRGGGDADVMSILADLRIAGNLMRASGTGVSLEGAAFHIGPVAVEQNTILAARSGVSATGTTLGGNDLKRGRPSSSGLRIAGNAIAFERGGSGISSGVLELRVLDNDVAALRGEGGEGGGACVRLVEGAVPLLPGDAQIVGNRLGACDGLGLSVEAAQASLIVKRNTIRDCEDGAVAVRDSVAIDNLSFDNNLVERVATRESREPRCAVRLNGVAEARMLGNSVRGVGSGAPGPLYSCGFDINGAGRLDVSHNVITAIRSGERATALGVFVRGGILACSISANHIFESDEESGRSPGSWCAIAVANSLGRAGGAVTGAVATHAVARTTATRSVAAMGMPVYAEIEREIYAIGLNWFWPFARSGGPQIRIAGNIVSDVHAQSGTPLVLVDSALGTCAFSDNQCTLAADGPVEAIVSITVPRIIAANNDVRRRSDRDAMKLVGGSFGQKPTVTVLGNVTFGNIRVNGGNVPAPFAPINILAM